METYKLRATTLMETVKFHQHCRSNEIELIPIKIEWIEKGEEVEMEIKSSLDSDKLIELIKEADIATESSGYNLLIMRQTIQPIDKYNGEPDLKIE